MDQILRSEQVDGNGGSSTDLDLQVEVGLDVAEGQVERGDHLGEGQVGVDVTVDVAVVAKHSNLDIGGSGGEVASFLPVEIVRAPELGATPSPGEGRIEIELAGGHRLRIVGSYDPEALARLLRGLSA